MRKAILAIIVYLLPEVCWAENVGSEKQHEVTVSMVDALKITGALIDAGNIKVLVALGPRLGIGTI